MPIYELDGKRPDLAGSNELNDNCWIAPDASVIGAVVIEANASLWFGCVLRGDNERIKIGKGSNVQDLAMCHTDPGYPLTVGADCTIGHQATLHGCTIGDNSLVGMGAMVMNGAVIGKNCLIGAGALIPEGKTISDGSLVVGAPGKIVRTLDEQALQMLRASAEIYRKKAAAYRSKLKRL